jgi:hypothetical protein
MKKSKNNYKQFFANFNAKDKERRDEIVKLESELSEIEEQEEMNDVKRIDEIVYELNILDPLTAKHDEPKVPMRKPIRRFVKPVVTAASILLMLMGVQVYSVAMGGNFLADVSTWSNDMIDFIMGNEIEIDGVQIWGSELRMYDSAEEFREKEGIDVFIPELINGSKLVQIDYAFQIHRNVDCKYENDSHLEIYLEDENMQIYVFDEDIKYKHKSIDYYINQAEKQIVWTENNYVYIMSGNINISEYKQIINDLK